MKKLINSIIVHNELYIKGFFYDYRWLSNFHECDVEFEDIIYPSSENAYQAAKTLDLNERDYLETCSSKEAKYVGRDLTLRKDWNEVRFSIMEIILRDKFTRNDNLKQLLIDTGRKYLEETNYWKDTYWGVCDGMGQNNLGKLLMKIRGELNG